MEDGLVHKVTNGDRFATASLNPCCNGRWSRTPDALPADFKLVLS